MKIKILIFALALLPCVSVFSQVTLEYCYEQSEKIYPRIKDRALIEKTREFTLKNASAAYYPQFGLSAKATFQSDVTTVPIEGFKSIPKDQYQAVVELKQSIWDAGVVRNQKKEITASAEVELQRLKVELYTLRERVNNLFFGILMLDKKLEINILFDAELKRNLSMVQSYLSAGVANSADIDAVEVEILSNNQNRVAMKASRAAYCTMLSEMVGEKVDMLTEPSKPMIANDEINRPELELFDAQIVKAETQKKIIKSRNLPKLGAFVQGAYGNPGLNMLKAGFTPYAIGGAQLTWNFGGYYTQRRELSNISITQQSIEVQRDLFLYNTKLSISQIDGEINRLAGQMRDDERIITLRGNIKRSSQAKVEGGTMSITDMLRDVTAENSAIATKSMHEVELLMTLYNIKNQYNQ